MSEGYSLHIVTTGDFLERVRTLVKVARQGARITQSELARKAGLPATTLSRLERTGLASTDALARVLFALNELDGVDSTVAARLRQWQALSEGAVVRQRVRHTKERT